MKEPKYARRIYDLALTSPEVNILNEDEVKDYVRQKAEELFLDGDEIVAWVEGHHPTTADVKKASELSGLPTMF